MRLSLASLGLVGVGLVTASLAACGGSDEESAGVTAKNPYGLTAEQCAASPAPAVFGNSLCVCGDFTDVGNLVVEGSDDGTQGSVAINGTAKIVNNTKVAGSFASGKALSAIGNVNVGRSLYSPADVSVTGNVEIGRDLQVGGTLSGIGRLAVKGSLGVRGQNRMIGYQQVATKGSYADAPVTPCGCEGNKGYLDVDTAIDRAKAKNDNAAKKVPTSLGAVGYTDLTLETGAYYFGGAVKSIGFQHVRVKGAVEMYIDGSLEQIGAEVFDIADGSTLDVYVRGTVQTIGHMRLGDAKNPSAFRLFIGGGDDISLAIGNQVFHGAVYAPKARLKYVGNTIVEGALFAKELTGIGNMEIRSARPTPPTGCPGSKPGAPSSGGDGGAPKGGGSNDAGSSSSSSGGSSSGGSSSGGSSSGDTGTTDPSQTQRPDGVGTPPLR